MAIEENFKLIYKILSTLENSLEYEEFKGVNNEMFEVPKAKFQKILIMLLNAGYIKARIIESMEKVIITDIEITLKGLEYLKENTLMKKIQNQLKGIKEIVPFV